MATPIITDGSTDRVKQYPQVVLPSGAELFSDRAARLSALAGGHSMAGYLQVLAALAHAQAAACGAQLAGPVEQKQLDSSRDYGMPPLSAQSHERAAAWRADLRAIVAAMAKRPEPGVTGAIAELGRMSDADIESLADRVLAGTTLDADAALVPFVGAALQVYFTRLAASLDVANVSRCDVPGICPVCATRPVASIVRIGGDRNNLRYLACALCGTEWHLTRALCSSCQTEKSLHYLTIEQEGRELQRAVARAEACDECKSYLKIFFQEHDAAADPMADDLATLSLDLLVDENGFARSGPNLLIHPGSS